MLKRGPAGSDSRGIKCHPVVSAGMQRKGLCGKRSISDVLIFWLLFYQEKSNSPSGCE
jgi:hypothetical protein